MSADVHLEAPKTVVMRKMATDERMGKRRASLKSLESDFEKAKHFIQRGIKSAASSSSVNSSIDENDREHQSRNSECDTSHDSLDSIDTRHAKSQEYDGSAHDRIDCAESTHGNIGYNKHLNKHDSSHHRIGCESIDSTDGKQHEMSMLETSIINRRQNRLTEGGMGFSVKKERPFSSHY